ncbi:MAG TPA: hypothetical protein VJ020_08305 [Anaerolineales bacterium]|nr:hypothetical protein [Anaerolineales bacterium]
MDRLTRWLLLLSMGALALAIIVCATLTLFAPRRIELFHLAYFNACAIHAYQYHWQDAARLRENFRYDFTMSPDSFVLAEVWVIGGPILKFSQKIPIECV